MRQYPHAKLIRWDASVVVATWALLAVAGAQKRVGRLGVGQKAEQIALFFGGLRQLPARSEEALQRGGLSGLVGAGPAGAWEGVCARVPGRWSSR